MKIIHILQNLKGGGIQNLLLSLASAQVRKNNEVTLIVTDKDNLEYSKQLGTTLESNGVLVIYLNRKIHNKLSTIITIIKCSYWIKKIKPDIINTHGTLCHIYGAISSLFNKKSTHLITIHNAPELWNTVCLFLNKDKPLIFCSQSAYELNNHISKDKIVIPNGVDRNIVVTTKQSLLKEEFHLSKDSKLIVSVGSLRKQKNYHFLVKLAAEYENTNTHFFICGGHYGKGYIDPTIFTGYKNIHWLGLRSDVSAIENECDCFISSSTFEGLPIAVLEAFNVGIPCVLSPIPQHENIAQGVYGCYIPQRFEITAFKKALNNALEHTETKSQIYKFRKEKLSEYSIEKTANQYINFYSEILKK